MELVLGLATLATAISSVGGANHIDESPNIVEAEPKTVQTMNERQVQEFNELPESHIGNLKEASLGITPKGRPIDNWEHYMNESENNDSFANSNDTGIYNYTFSTYESGDKPTSYYKTVYGSIGQEGDVDYYKFTLYGKANVTITLGDIPAQCDYDLRLYEQGTGLFSAAQAINEIGSSTRGSNNSESLTKFLYPNTYYIKVYSCKGYGSPYYNLGLNVSYQRGEDQNISDLKNMGSKGALWLSDWDPYGIKPSISDSRAPIGSEGHWYRQYSRTESARGNFDSTHFTFPIQTGVYKHAQLFVWDDDLRAQMLTFVSLLHDAVEQQVHTQYEIQIQADIDELANGTVLSIMGFIPIAGTAISIMQIAYDLVKGIWDIVCPPEDVLVTKTNFVLYLARLKEALTWYYPQGDSRVLTVPMRYYVVKKVNESKGYPTTYPLGSEVHSTNYYLTYQPIDSYESFEYRDSKIYVQDPENPFTGTIFPIADDDGIHKALNRETYDMSFAAFNNNSEKYLSIGRGEYKWFKFTAPHNGTYYFNSTGDEEITIDIFNDMVYGKSDHNRVHRFYKNNGINTGINCNIRLEEDQTIYLRVSGGNGSYTALSSTNIKIADTRFPSVFARINAWDLEVPMNLDNPFFFNSISVGNQYNLYVSSVGAFYNTSRGAIELLCDRDNNKPFAFLIMLFDRPIKQINFGSCIGNSYSYACLGLYLQGLNQYGFPVTEDVVDTYCNDHLLPYDLRYDNRDEAIYGVMFRIDPETDTSPYHVGYQEQLIGDFVVEFND